MSSLMATSFDGIRLSGVSASTTVPITAVTPSSTCDMPGKLCSYGLSIGNTATSISLGHSASGVMTIKTLVDAAENQIARIPNVAIGDGQPPIIYNKDIKIIGPNQLMVNGTEPLRADTATFADLRVDHDGDNTGTPRMCTPDTINTTCSCARGSVVGTNCVDGGGIIGPASCNTTTTPGTCTGGSNTNPNATPYVERNITNVSRGSNANSLLITFDGEPVPTAAKGTVDIKNTLTDFNDNTANIGPTNGERTITKVGFDDRDVLDGQPPQVKSAKITEINTIEWTFSERLSNNTSQVTSPLGDRVRVHGKANYTLINAYDFAVSTNDPREATTTFGITNSVRDVLSDTNIDKINNDTYAVGGNIVYLPGLNDSVGITIVDIKDEAMKVLGRIWDKRHNFLHYLTVM